MKNLKNYYRGKGCKCSAYGEDSCCCEGADWTPKEVYILKNENERLRQIIEGLLGQLNNLTEIAETELDKVKN